MHDNFIQVVTTVIVSDNRYHFRYYSNELDQAQFHSTNNTTSPSRAQPSMACRAESLNVELGLFR
jgi:hypothetical protein